MITLKDIARQVGVHVSVVSRALNPTPDKNAVVAPQTQQRILAIAKQMGYRRNRIAEFLKKGQSATIGVFLPEAANRLVADLMFGISKQAARQDFPLNFFFGETQGEFMAFIRDTNHAAHSGIITYPFNPSLEDEIGKTIDAYRQKGGHVIVLNAARNYPGIPVLKIDDTAGGQLAARHLLSKKCACFLYEAAHNSERGRAFAKVIRESGHSPHAFTADNEAEVYRHYLHLQPAARVGIFYPTDVQAVSALRLLANYDRHLGKDLLIMGYDDLNLTQFLPIPLTTIHQPFEQLGIAAVEKLIRMIYGKKEGHEKIRPRLVERQSTQGD